MSRWPLWVWVAIAGGLVFAWGGIVLAKTLGILKRSAKAAQLGITNEPEDAATAARLKHTARMLPYLLTVLREYDPGAHLTSGFRNATVNAATPGASATSRHRHGLAVDINNGWDHGGTFGAAVHLRANQSRIPAPLRDVLAEDNHLHVEFIDPLGQLDPDGRLARFKYELPNPVDGHRFETIPA